MLSMSMRRPDDEAEGGASKSTIDRKRPHQVALGADDCTGRDFRTIHYFIATEKLSHCARGHHFYRDGVGYNVHCFAEREHAERLLQRFGGEMIKPEDRPRWPGKPRRRAATPK